CQGRQPVGRRAAGDGDRPRADDQSRHAAPRRSVARPGAAGRRAPLRIAALPHRQRHDDRAGRTGLVARHGRGRPRDLHAGGPHRAGLAERQRHARGDHAGLFRPARQGCGEGCASMIMNQLVQGVLLGGYYALIACGLSFMFSVMRIINLAHGSLAVLSAYALFVLADRYDIGPFYGLLLVIPAMAAIGWLLQRLVLDRSARGGLLVPVLATFGLAIVIDNLLFEQFGADTRSLAPYIDTLSYDAWQLSDDIYIGQLSALTFGAAVVLLGGLQLFLRR